MKTPLHIVLNPVATQRWKIGSGKVEEWSEAIPFLLKDCFYKNSNK
jgi:hypothetical protein